MSALCCPECGSWNLITSFDPDYYECLECGKVSYITDCRVKQKKSDKLLEKSSFDDEDDFPPEKKMSHRDNLPEDPFEELDDYDEE